MVEDNPRQNELEDLVKFCNGKDIYIWGLDETQKMISKYFWYSEIPLKGFIKPEVYNFDREHEPFPILNIGDFKGFSRKQKKNTGVIIATCDELYNQIIETLKIVGIKNYFLVSDWNKGRFLKRCFRDVLMIFILK